jgi:hypothetical protein
MSHPQHSQPEGGKVATRLSELLSESVSGLFTVPYDSTGNTIFDGSQKVYQTPYHTRCELKWDGTRECTASRIIPF